MSQDDDMKKIIRKGIDKYLILEGRSIDGRVPGTERATPEEITEALTKYYVKEIAYYTSYINEEDKIESGLDGDDKNEPGIDFIYEKPEDKEFWIIQSKYKGGGKELHRSDIVEFFNIHEKIPGLVQHPQAKEFGELLDDVAEDPLIICVLLTNAEAGGENHRLFKQLAKKKSAMFKTGSVQWELMDLAEMKLKYKQIPKEDGELPGFDIPVAQCIELPIDNNNEHKSFVAIVQGNDLNDLKNYGNALFNYNIRSFLGDKGKNKQITETLEKEPGLFYLYNNGISAICTEMSIESSQKGVLGVSCKNFQIINGAQTVGSIHDFGINRKNIKKLKQVKVLMRITEVERVAGRTEGLTGNMIRYNNSQNVIRDADFKSNDPIQEELAARFIEQEILYHADSSLHKVVYMPKRVQRSKEGEIHVSMDSLAKSLYVFKKNTPAKINSLTKFLFEESDKDGYLSLFGDENQKRVEASNSEQVINDRFDEFAAVAILNHFLESKHQGLKKGTKPDEIQGMVVRTGRLFLWAFGYVIRKFYCDSEGEIYKKIINGEAFNSETDEEGFVHVWYKYIYEKLYDFLIHETDKSELFEDDKTAFNFKTWLRDNKKMSRLMRTIDRIGANKKLPKI